MRMNRLLHTLVMALALVLIAGCQSKGPTPKEADPSGTPKVGSTETGGADPSVGTQDPHAGIVPPQGARAGDVKIDAKGMMDVGAVAFKVPGKWQVQPPKSSMRRAQLVALGSAGPAELVVFFFGPQGAGSAEENIDRWIGQFTNPDGSPVTDAKKSSSKVSGFDVTKLEVTGQYASGMGGPGQAQAPRADQRLMAAIVNTGSGPYYFKFLGPSPTVAENGAIFDELLASIVPSP